MKKNIPTTRVFLLITVFALLLAAGAMVGFLQSKWVITGEEERAWARDAYDVLFHDPLSPLPTLVTAPEKPGVRIDPPNPNEISLSWPSSPSQPTTDETGRRVTSDPGTAAALLPTGQEVTFLGVAVRLPTLNDEDYGEAQLDWHDPVTLHPLSDAASRGLPLRRHMDLNERKLILAFRCTETETRPVRWHFVRARNAKTLTAITYGGSWGETDGVMLYSVDLDLYHDTPVDISLPVSCGEPEIVSLSPRTNDDSRSVSFPSEAAEVSVLFATNGNQNGSSSSSGGNGMERAGFRWRDVEKGRPPQSFALLRVWPELQSNMLQWRLPPAGPKQKTGWSAVHGWGGIDALEFKVPIEAVEEIELRRFPTFCHCIFHLSGVPGFPEVNNLFQVESGPIRFRYSSELNRFVSRATATQWNIHHRAWDSSEFPMDFDNVTPAEVLRMIEERTGERFHVHPGEHRIEKPPQSFLEKASEWLRKFFSP